MFDTSHLILIFFIVFILGCIGIIIKRDNCLLALLAIEVMYLGIIASFIIISIQTNNPLGQIYALIILIVAACESSVGLGILIILYHWGRSLTFSSYQALHG